ncbi:MAG: hypothetical protein M4579_006019 [Chaenotheca gracillima]|nr:MAG: hypothetical protein M4579_006019 [Chaenotheca gracillima]
MTSADVRDMLDLPLDRHRPAKKQKLVEKRPDGITRELFSLIGERAPPVAITSHVKYKERPKWSHKVQPWEMRPFTNPARDDGLVLKHWKRKPEVKQPSQEPNADSKETTADGEASTSSQPESDYYYAKFNVKVSLPQFTEAQYEKHLQDDDWSKDETEYLRNLCQEYDLRWILIADRYDYHPTAAPADQDENSNVSGLVPTPKQRTMEDLKARYYTVAAKMMIIHHPLEDMLPEEYDQYERLTKFNPIQETQRKNMAEALIARNPEDVKEEEVLLAELRRIINNQDRLLEERKELYARLEAPQSSGNTQMYQSSQGLAQLMQTLLAADKNKKRRSLIGPNGETNSSPAVGDATPTQRDGRDGTAASTGAAAGHRDSIGGAGGNKKGAGAGAAPTPVSERRKLTPREEEQYGISHHDRVNSGVSFRHERVSRLAQAKSNVQAQRVATLLAELEIPPRLVMPTSAVCTEYERLIRKLHDLIDLRKVSEKVEGEVKVAQAAKDEKERKETGDVSMTDGAGEEKKANGASEAPGTDGAADVEMGEAQDADATVDGETVESRPVKEEEGVEEEDNAEPVAEADGEVEVATTAPARPSSSSRAGSSNATTRPSSSRGGYKRSASVMSTRSDKSLKRQKK